MNIDYKNMTNEELSELVLMLKTELDRREKSEIEKRWSEVVEILTNWLKDYGKISVFPDPYHTRFLEHPRSLKIIGEIRAY